MRGFALLGISLTAALVLSASSQAQTRVSARAFDGAWSIEVVTEQGACDRAYRYNIVIENGRARYGGPENFTINGQVRGNGQVSGSIARGQDRATVRGRLSGARGTGTWTTSGGRTCAGTWNAEKRG